MSVRYLQAWSDPPSGWTFQQSVRLLSPDGRASVVVDNEPVDAGVDADDYARVSLASMQREFPGFELQQEGRTFFRGIGDVPWYQVTWVPVGGRRTKQLQVYAVQDSRGTAITATCADDDWDEFEEPFWETIANAVIPDAIPAGPAGEGRSAANTERRIFDSDRRDDRSTDRDEGFGGRVPSHTDGITIVERGIEVDHVTIHRWVQRFTPLLINAARPCRRPAGGRWFVAVLRRRGRTIRTGGTSGRRA